MMIPRAETYLPYYYGETLSGEIAFEDFFTLTQRRLAVLKKIDEFDLETDSKDRMRGILNELKELKGIGNKQEQNNDVLSHYFLRIAYSKNKDLRDWFVKQETIIFRARLHDAYINSGNPTNLIKRELINVKSKYGETFCPFEIVENLSEADSKIFKRYKEYLEEKGIFLKDGFIKVPFEYIPRFVSDRSAFLRGGTAYLPIKDGVYLLETFFKRNLEDVTKKAKKILPYLEEVNGLFADYLQNIENLLFVSKDYSKISSQRHSQINLADIDIHANSNYPLCMRQMHQNIKINHHLRHTGRIQYNLFLKGIGLSLDDAIKFWRSEFTKKMTKETFDKNYVYNIRHCHGKEGKRTDYTPWSCSRIILESSPGKGEVHGCPFKEYNETNLRRLLLEFKLNSLQIDEIIEKKRGSHFQVACKLFFLASHPNAIELEGVGVHPNGYFEASLSYYTPNDKKNTKNTNNKSVSNKNSAIKAGPAVSS